MTTAGLFCYRRLIVLRALAEDAAIVPEPEVKDAATPAATEHRGMTLTQLLDLQAKIDSHADKDGYLPGWFETAPGREHIQCHKDTIHLYDVTESASSARSY